MNGTVDVSVIVVSHGHEAMLADCLGSLGRALDGVSAEILLVDNLPRGEMAAVLSGLAVSGSVGPVRLIENARPLGLSENVNLAAAEARGAHLFILNPDTAHRDGRIGDALAFLATRPEIGMLGCTLLNSDGTAQQNFRRFPTFAFMLAKVLRAERWPWQPAFFRRGMMDGERGSAPYRVDWVFGAAMLLPRPVFDAVGGMDEGFRLYYEDVDLAWRLGQRGLQTWIYPGLCFDHAHQRTSARNPFSQVWRWHMRSALRYLFKTRGRAPVAARSQGSIGQ